MNEPTPLISTKAESELVPSQSTASLPLSRRQWLGAMGISALGAYLPDLAESAEPLPSAPLLSKNDLLFWSATRLAKKIRDKKVSSEEVVDAHLRRIEQVNSKLNAIVLLASETALADAREADRALARGDLRGPLHGVPMTVKDCLDTKDVRTTAGTKGYANRVPKDDATAVARMKAAGAILLGKTNLPEFALAAESDNLLFGRANNPYNLDRTPGGSSGGEGAIIAAAGSPVGLGSDAGGSIRLPAAFNGIAGLKQTLGRAPISGHSSLQGMSLCMDVAVIGPMSRHVEDLGLVLSIISGPDPWDPTVISMPPADPKAVNLRKLRVAFYTDNGVLPADAETAAIVKATAKALQDAGMQVDQKTPPMISQVLDLFWGIFCTDGGDGFRQYLASIGSKEIHPFTSHTFELSKPYVPQNAAQTAMLVMRRFGLRAALHNFMQQFDVLLSPVAPMPAPPHGEFHRNIDRNISYTCLHNLTGWPAVSVRAGSSKEGLPIGVQVAAPPLREDVALAVAQHIETAMSARKTPSI